MSVTIEKYQFNRRSGEADIMSRKDIYFFFA